LHSRDKQAQGHANMMNTSTPCPAILKKYTSLLNQQDDISLVKALGARSQGARRQMAGTSMRNTMSQVATLLVTSYVKGSYEKPKDLPDGSNLGHKVMEQLTGQKMKPIHAFQHVNYDMTSTYVFDGAVPNNPGQDHWARVSTATQARGTRNRKSIWINEEEMKFNGISVKWCDGASGSGHIMPMVAIFSGLSETEMPSKAFIVLEVAGMSMNANLDARSSEVGYILCY